MKKIKIKHLLYLFMLGLICTIFFKYEVVSFSEYKFVITGIGVLLKNISIILFLYKILKEQNTRKIWSELLEC